YLEIAKVQIPRDWDAATEAERTRGENTQLVLGRVLDTVFRLLHPSMPFVTETLWTVLTDGVDGYADSLVVTDWPTAANTNGGAQTDVDAVRRLDDVEKLVTEVRRFRADQGVKPTQKVPGRFDAAAADLAGLEDAVRSIVRLTAPAEDFTPTASVELRLSGATITVELDTSGTVDVAAERKRLEKDLAEANKELERADKKLGNDNFLAKAPEKVVAEIRERRGIAADEVERINARLTDLAGK
ncbi:MAG: class I tRNA ligase family protein, partial [Corynebacterium sp.]